MKKLLFWMVVIVGIVALIGSCAKKDDSTAATATAAASTLDPPTCPSDNTDCITAGWHQNAMDWNAVTGATSYTIYWSTSTGVSSSSTAITGITDDNYTHTGLDNGTTYYYKAATVNSAGTGSLSDEVSATPRAAPTVAAACTTQSTTETPGGIWGGIKDDKLTSGQFFFSYRGQTHATGCEDNTTFLTVDLASYIPSGTLGWKTINTMTGNTTWTRGVHWYADADCTKETGFFATGYDNLTMGDNITIAGQPCTDCSSTYVPYGTKLTYNEDSYCLLAENEIVKTFIYDTYGGITVTVGTAWESAGDGTSKGALMVNLDNVSSSITDTWISFRDGSTPPDNWTLSNGSDGADVMYSLDNVSSSQ